MDTFGARLAKAIKNSKLKKVFVATSCGVDRVAIYNWEHDLNFPSVENLMTLCNLLGVSSDYLLCIKNEETQIAGIPPKIIKAAKKLAQFQPEQRDAIVAIIEGFSASKKEAPELYERERFSQLLEAIDDLNSPTAPVRLDLSGYKKADTINKLYSNPELKTKAQFTAEIIKLSSRR